MSTFVSVGNATQPFSRLLSEVARLAPHLPQPVTVQTGSTPFANGICRAVPFLGMEDFEAHVRRAQLLIVHAGAGTVINALQAGKCPVVAPRLARYAEHIDNHQLEFARALARQGKIAMAEEMHLLQTAIEDAMSRRATSAAAKSQPPLIGVVQEILDGYAAAARR